MMPQRQDRTGFDRFNLMDEAISQFRKFATEKQVNIIIVIHPKKEDDKLALGISSIFGTAKATQESDVILILQRIEGDAYLDVKKNRSYEV
jgi:twinkle protein